jgi:hypothetical protein
VRCCRDLNYENICRRIDVLNCLWIYIGSMSLKHVHEIRKYMYIILRHEHMNAKRASK